MTYKRAFQRTIKEWGQESTGVLILVCCFLLSLSATVVMGLKGALLLGLIDSVFVMFVGLVIGTLVEKDMPKYIRQECEKIGIEYTPYDTETGE